MTATTNDPLNREVHHCRDLLAAALAERAESNHLARLINRLARAEGERDVRRAARLVAQEGGSHEAIRRIVSGLLVGPLDDDWSGRTGDVNRSKFVGMQQEVAAMFSAIDGGRIDTYLAAWRVQEDR